MSHWLNSSCRLIGNWTKAPAIIRDAGISVDEFIELL
jgi:hypothetical protein